MKKHRAQPIWRDHYELVRDSKVKNKLHVIYWIIDHYIYKKK